jgi:hypothetical protein
MKRASAEVSPTVARALRIIGPVARRADVERALRSRIFVQRLKDYKRSGIYGIQTKQQKLAAKGFEVALRRLKAALKNLKDHGLHQSLLVNFPMDQEYIEIWRKRVADAAEAVLPSRRLGGPSSYDAAKRFAATAAAQLLQKHNLPLTVGRRSKFCRLAALFYSDEVADFRHICAAVKKDRFEV